MEEESRSFEQTLLKNMLSGLQLESSTALFRNTSLQQRKRDIKLSADIAMAMARGNGPNWARALIAGHSKRHQPKISRTSYNNNKVLQSKRILKKARRSPVEKRRSRVLELERLVPGGVALKGYHSLMVEALDYAVSLRAQVDVMRWISLAVEASGGRIFTSVKGSVFTVTDQVV